MTEQFDAELLHEDKLVLPRASARLAVCDMDAADGVSCEHTILLFAGGRQSPPELFQPGAAVAVVDSEDKKTIVRLSGTDLPAITCGLSPRDTITLSSIATDSAVINLQRSVQCFDGSVAEPQEIPVKLREPVESFALMALACIFILCGEIAKLADVLI